MQSDADQGRPRTPASAGGKRRGRPVARARPHSERRWTVQRIRIELAEMHGDRTTMMSTTELRKLGRGDLVAAMSRTGGVARWSQELGIARHEHRTHDYGWDQARADAERAIKCLGALPGGTNLRANGFESLARFIKNRPRNRRRFLTELGYPAEDVDRLIQGGGPGRPRRWSPDTLEAQLRRFIGEQQDWPPDRLFVTAGFRDLLEAVRYHGGKAHWARVVGVHVKPLSKPGSA